MKQDDHNQNTDTTTKNGHNYHQSLIVIAWYYKTEKNLEMISSSDVDVSQDEKISYRQQSHREKGAWPQSNWVG